MRHKRFIGLTPRTVESAIIGAHPLLTALALLSALILANGLWDWRERRKTLAQIRRAWAEPPSPKLDMTGIASYHDGIARRHPDSSIDDRTWRDLDLDAVYEVLDRATSRVGQQLLYHRLRSRGSVASAR